MDSLDKIASEFFNKIRSRFKHIKLGDAEGAVTTEPESARFFDFDFAVNGRSHGRVNAKLDDSSVLVIYNNSLLDGASENDKQVWFELLRDFRQFARRNMLNFDTRDITKSNLDVRDYKHLARKPVAEAAMRTKKYVESVGSSKIIVTRKKSVYEGNTEFTDIDSIFIENKDGERFKYPQKSIGGARAMARHVSNGGSTYDAIGSGIIEMVNELAALRKFKNHARKSVNEEMGHLAEKATTRITELKRTLSSIQGERGYQKFKESFKQSTEFSVPESVSQQWIDALTTRKFNEELTSTFNYVYRLVAENNVLSYDDIVKNSQEVNKKHVDAADKTAKINELSAPVIEYISSFYDRETGTFPRGEEGVKIAVEKKFGNKAGKFAGYVIEKLRKR